MWWAPWLYGYIPTNRTNLAPSTIKMARQVLRKSDILGIFPEGTSTAEEVRPAKNGAVYLSTVTQSPIVPVSIVGLENALTGIKTGDSLSVRIEPAEAYGEKDESKKQVLNRCHRLID